MSQLQNINEPNSTEQLLGNLNFAIDEAKLVRSIIELSDQIRRIESAWGPSRRTLYLNREIDRLEAKLSDARYQARNNL